MTRKPQKEKHHGVPWVETNGLYDEGSPWAIQANNVHKKNGFPLEKCRDIVILNWLLNGDLRPLQALLIMGKAPAPMILQAIGAMMNREASTPEEIPFLLVLKDRTGKRGVRNNPENDVRDFCLYEQVKMYMQKNGRGTYESALIYVAKEFGVGEKTVRDAYNKYKKNDLGQE